VGFDVLLPLKRGRGRESVTAAERAAQEDLEATRLAYLHQKSRSVLDATLAYWELRAAQEEIGVLNRSVKLQESFLTMTRALVKARQLPRAEETRALAGLADAKARLEAADRRMRQAQVALAKVMGVALADLETAPMAAEEFPTPPKELLAEPDRLAELVQTALTRRQDRLAAERSHTSAGILVRGAQLDARRLVNLDVRLWGNSVSEDSPSLDRWVFKSGRAGIEVEVPLKNDQLMGRLAQRRATESRTMIDMQDLERTIGLAVLRNAGTLRDAIQQLELAAQAVRQYDQTVDDEQARFKLGESTLIDVIVTEQQATAARQALIAAAQGYAGLVATLRYEAGLIVENPEGQASVTTASLMEVPEALRPVPAPPAAPEGDAPEGGGAK
jgi:outer membrane protein TolC